MAPARASPLGLVSAYDLLPTRRPHSHLLLLAVPPLRRFPHPKVCHLVFFPCDILQRPEDLASRRRAAIHMVRPALSFCVPKIWSRTWQRPLQDLNEVGNRVRDAQQALSSLLIPQIRALWFMSSTPK